MGTAQSLDCCTSHNNRQDQRGRGRQQGDAGHDLQENFPQRSTLRYPRETTVKYERRGFQNIEENGHPSRRAPAFGTRQHGYNPADEHTVVASHVENPRARVASPLPFVPQTESELDAGPAMQNASCRLNGIGERLRLQARWELPTSSHNPLEARLQGTLSPPGVQGYCSPPAPASPSYDRGRTLGSKFPGALPRSVVVSSDQELRRVTFHE
jgi:hypothetical protein